MFSSWLSCFGKERIATERPVFLQKKLSCYVERFQLSISCYWVIMIAYFWDLLAALFGFLMKLSKIFSPLNLPLSYLSVCSDVRWLWRCCLFDPSKASNRKNSRFLPKLIYIFLAIPNNMSIRLSHNFKSCFPKLIGSVKGQEQLRQWREKKRRRRKGRNIGGDFSTRHQDLI